MMLHPKPGRLPYLLRLLVDTESHSQQSDDESEDRRFGVVKQTGNTYYTAQGNRAQYLLTSFGAVCASDYSRQPKQVG